MEYNKMQDDAQEKFLNIDRKKLVDVRKVKIDIDLPVEERIKSYLEQIGNPYCFLCDGIVVQVAFAETEATIEDRIAGIISQH